MHLICLHNVIPGPIDAFDEKCSRISVAEFEAFLDAVAARFDLVSYSTYAQRLRTGGTDDTVALSFDDGFLGVKDHALPVLAARGLDAIAFINPPYLGNPPDRIFHFLELEIAFRLTAVDRLQLSFADEPLDLTQMKPRVKALKRVKKLLKTRPEADRATGHAEVLDRLGVPLEAIHSFAKGDARFQLMAPDGLQVLVAAGWSIGSHAMSHRTLSMLDDEDRWAEIDGARRYFRDQFGWTEMTFAYPYGDHVHVGDSAPRDVARASHPMAFTTIPGASDLAHAPHRLPRIDYKRFLRDYRVLNAA